MHEEVAKVFQDCYNEIIYPKLNVQLISETSVPYAFGFMGSTKSRKYND